MNLTVLFRLLTDCPERERGSERIKTAKHSVKRYLAYLLVCALVMSNISVAAYAADTASVPDDEISITQEETISDPENDASSDFEILKEENAESSDTEIFEKKCGSFRRTVSRR